MGNVRTIIPLAEFKSNIKHWLDYIGQSHDPLVVTRHGRGAFVVQRVDSYAGMAEMATEARHQLALQDALRDLDEEPIVPPRLRKSRE